MSKEQQKKKSLTVSITESVSTTKYKMRWWILLVLSISLLIIIIDETIVNVAIPTLQLELGASASGLQWITAAYIVVFAGVLLTMGSLGDRFGRKRALQAGLVIFGLASVFAANSQVTEQLIASRALMGLGAALIMPSTLSVIIAVFPREERLKAIGIWTGVAALGLPLGPVLGGWLLQMYGWGSIFLINIPIILIALGAGFFLVPESRNPRALKIDIPGAVTSFGALASLLYGIIEAPELGLLNPIVLGAFASAFILGTVFVRHELRTAHPMLDMRLFRNARFSSATLAIVATFLTFTGFAFIYVQYLQIVRGNTPLETGLLLLPLIVSFIIGAGSSSQVVSKLGTRLTVTMGLSIVAATMVGLAYMDGGASYWIMGIYFALLGFGIGTTVAPSTAAILGAVPEANAGVGSAVNDTAGQVGSALGIGILGSVLNSTYSSNVAGALGGLPTEAAAAAKNFVGGAAQVAADLGGPAGEALRTAANTAFLDGLSVALLGAAAIAFVGALLVFRFMPARDLAVDKEV